MNNLRATVHLFKHMVTYVDEPEVSTIISQLVLFAILQLQQPYNIIPANYLSSLHAFVRMDLLTVA